MRRSTSCLGLVWLLTNCTSDPQAGSRALLEDDAAVAEPVRADAAPLPIGADAQAHTPTNAQQTPADSGRGTAPDDAALAPSDATSGPLTLDAGFPQDAQTPPVDPPLLDPTAPPKLVVSTPSISRDDTFATVCAPLKPDNLDSCPAEYCFDAVQSLTANVQTGYGFTCMADCAPSPLLFELSGESDAGENMSLLIYFSQRVTASDSGAVLRARLSEVRGGISAGDFSSFYSDPSQIELLENSGGRLHIRGWGMVFANNYLQPSLPRACGGEILHICSTVQCNYGEPGSEPNTFTGYAWLHYDVEANVSNSPVVP